MPRYVYTFQVHPLQVGGQVCMASQNFWEKDHITWSNALAASHVLGITGPIHQSAWV